VVALALRGAADAPALQALLYPATDLTCSFPSHRTMQDAFILDARSIAWYRGHYLGADPPAARLREPRLSPWFADDLAGVAPAYVVTAGFDPLRDEGVAYGERLRAAGVDAVLHDEPSLVHGFLLLTAISHACARATDAVCDRIGARLAAPGLPARDPPP
jgi:acetyl esterase